jgi:hypothetical protein
MEGLVKQTWKGDRICPACIDFGTAGVPLSRIFGGNYQTYGKTGNSISSQPLVSKQLMEFYEELARQKHSCWHQINKRKTMTYIIIYTRLVLLFGVLEVTDALGA